MLRRIFLQIGVLAGCLAFILTLWQTLGTIDVLEACLRATGAGVALLLFALLISRIVEKLGGPAE